jgi:hypothetical protein
MDARDPRWYRDEAKRLRERGEHANYDPSLRQSYLDLADEYDRLAEVLEKTQGPQQP